jgi:hypothetical protein
VTVGWDADRATFHAQVAVKLPTQNSWEDDWVRNEVRIGNAPQEVTTAREALRAVEPYAVVPPDLEAEMEAVAGPPALRRPTVLTINDGTYLATEGITTWLDGSDEPAEWTVPVDLQHRGDTADTPQRSVGQAFPALHTVDPTSVATAPSDASPSVAYRPGRQR